MMNTKITDFILDYLQRYYTINSEDIMSLNYVETGYIDSMALLLFISSIESEFGIEFTEEEINNNEFMVVGKLIDIVTKKCEGNSK